MSSTTPEQPKAQITPDQFLSAIQEKVRQMTPQEIAKAIEQVKETAASVKRVVDAKVATEHHGQVDFAGDPKEKDSPKAKAQSVKEVVQEVLTAMKTPGKELSPSLLKQVAPQADSTGKAILTRLSQAFPDVNNDISEQTAPYIYDIIQKTLNGDITDPDSMLRQLEQNQSLAAVSPEAFKKVQNVFVEAAKDMGVEEKVATEKFGVNDERQSRKGAHGLTDEAWQYTYASYFNPGDRDFVESLYTPTKFVDFVVDMQEKKAKKIGKDVHSEEVRIEVSKDIERKIVDLFGKLYTRLDQEKPSEFFHEIEQQDIMKGILPVKNELKRRMTLLATELDQAIHLGTIEDPHLFQSAEVRTKMDDLEMSTLDKKDTRTKARPRLNPYLQPVESHGGHFVHYLDQIVDHYIEARKYTHNARAIFLHPVDHEKGFYSQLAHFAEEMTTVDFDQMMALPDNEVFRDAFAMYDKMVEENFASHDWKHYPTMFELKQNSLRNQVEEDVYNKLKLMYDKQLEDGSMSEARLEAGLSMAVGASRGMFLNEIEKAAYADPHVTEEGRNTFASYYNQDNSALNAFNPMHFHYRWQTQNTIDPILFTPVENTEKGAGYGSMFSDHRELWAKMKGYKDSFVNGRKPTGIEGQTLFADFLVNIGKVGGPLQRKGWRTGYMLEPLYIRDPEDKTGKGYDMLKTWQRLENIGYEVAQDFVSKIDSRQHGFLGLYKGDAYEKKADLFKYIYGRYFEEGNPEGMNKYMKTLRHEVEAGVLKSVRSGASAPESIRAEVEKEASNLFLHRALARMISERTPTKILRLDRDRFSSNGIGRWRQIAEDIFPKDKLPPGKSQTDLFDSLMQDLMMGEQLLRKEVSRGMHDMVDKKASPWLHGSIEYRLTEEKLGQLLKGKLSAERISEVQRLLRGIQGRYTKNDKFLDSIFTPFIKNGEYRFSFAVDEVDMSFIPWRGGGARVLPRAISDISTVEKSVAGEVMKLPKTLAEIATNGKGDFTPILEIMTKCYGAVDAIIGADYAMQIVHNIAAVTINYFKKDTQARWAYGLFGLGRTNSIAAERAGRGRAWEWDSTDIDRFCYALETRSLLRKDAINVSNSHPEYTPIYINLPFMKTPIKLPFSMKMFGKEIKLFQKRKPDYTWTTKRLRDKFGGNWKDITFDYINKYLPLIIAWLMWKYISDALKESEGKKK